MNEGQKAVLESLWIFEHKAKASENIPQRPIPQRPVQRAPKPKKKKARPEVPSEPLPTLEDYLLVTTANQEAEKRARSLTFRRKNRKRGQCRKALFKKGLSARPRKKRLLELLEKKAKAKDPKEPQMTPVELDEIREIMEEFRDDPEFYLWADDVEWDEEEITA